jgi:hypothetical protein
VKWEGGHTETVANEWEYQNNARKETRICRNKTGNI